MLVADVNLDFVHANRGASAIGSLLVNGTFYKSETFDSKEEWQELFLPWNWPAVVRWHVWEWADGMLKPLAQLDARVENLADYAVDADEIREHYRAQIDELIHDEAGVIDGKVCQPELESSTVVNVNDFVKAAKYDKFTAWQDCQLLGCPASTERCTSVLALCGVA